MPTLAAHRDFLHGAVHRRNEAKQPGLQDIISSAALEGFDDEFLPHDAGYMNAGKSGQWSRTRAMTERPYKTDIE